MKVEKANHPSGLQLPIILDDDGLPIPVLNEFLLSKSDRQFNTLIRNSRELITFYKWAVYNNIDFEDKIHKGTFTEAEIKGSLIPWLRRDQNESSKLRKIVVSPNTYNQRVITVRNFLMWLYDVEYPKLVTNEKKFEVHNEGKRRLERFLTDAISKGVPENTTRKKGLNDAEAAALLNCIDPNNPSSYGRNEAVKHRNYVMVVLMLCCGLRPGELLSLRVADLEIGSIPVVRVTRRPPDPRDKRSPRPEIKRNAKDVPIFNATVAKSVDDYIVNYRDELEARAATGSEYLILSDDGEPLSVASLVQFFQIVRNKYSDVLPSNLTAKSLRHTFSSRMRKELKASGIKEEDQAKVLAVLRGDSSLSSQDPYVAGSVNEDANWALRAYQQKLVMEDVPW